jgi:hypothetical protein
MTTATPLQVVTKKTQKNTKILIKLKKIAELVKRGVRRSRVEGAGQRGEGQAWGRNIHPPHTITSLAGLERSLRG